MYGLKDTHIKKLHSVFSHYSAIEKVILYGSRAKGDYRNGSDIDLCLVGKTLDFQNLLKIEKDVDDLLLPYNIDLSIYHRIDHADLIEHIVPDKEQDIVVYCANADCDASPKLAEKLIEKGYTRVWDFEEGLAGWRKEGYEDNGKKNN